jgi:holo-[acyl-carrier protein] synthase
LNTQSEPRSAASEEGSGATSIGIDCESIERFRGLLGKRRLLERLFTTAELEESLNGRDPALLLALRFAAKEACLKALGTGLGAGLRWRDMETGRVPGKGDLFMRLSGAAKELAGDGRRVHLSTSSGAGLVVAMVAIG